MTLEDKVKNLLDSFRDEPLKSEETIQVIKILQLWLDSQVLEEED